MGLTDFIGDALNVVVPAAAGGLMAGPAGVAVGAGLGLMDMNKQRENYKMQKEFAQHGVEWRAQSARRAGISPIGGQVGGLPQYYPTGNESLDKAVKVGLNYSSLKNAKLQNEMLGLQIKEKKGDMEDPFKNYPGVPGIGSGIKSMFEWSFNPDNNGYYLTYTPENSEAIESDPMLRKEIDATRIFFRGKRLGMLTKEEEQRLIKMRPYAPRGYIAKWSRKTGRFYAVRKKGPKDIGLYLDPKYTQKIKKRDTKEPWEFAP